MTGAPEVVAFLASTRFSRARRVQAARRARRRLQGRGGLVVVCGALLLGSGTALATVGGEGERRASTPAGSSTVRAAQAELGVPVDGVVGPLTEAAIRRFQRARGLAVTGRLDATTLDALGLGPRVSVTKLDATVASRAAAAEVAEAAAVPESRQDGAPTTTAPIPPTTATPVTPPPADTTAEPTAGAQPPVTTTPEPAAAPAGPPDTGEAEGEEASTEARVGGALAGSTPTVPGGQLPEPGGLSPTPPRPASAPSRTSRKPAPKRPEISQSGGLSPRPPVDDPLPSAEMRAKLERIARCESGGNPRAVSPSGRYRGKYQFSRSTWRSVGGSGDPAAASEAEQDRRAAILYRRSGSAPWPVCGSA